MSAQGKAVECLVNRLQVFYVCPKGKRVDEHRKHGKVQVRRWTRWKGNKVDVDDEMWE